MAGNWPPDTARNGLDTLDQKIRRSIRRVEDMAERVPRRTWEVAGTAFFALFLTWLALKNFIYAFAAIVTLSAGIVLLRAPILLVYALFFMVPIAWVNLLGERLRIVTFLTVIGVGFFMTQAIFKRVSLKMESLYIAIGVYVIICLLSVLNSVDVAFSLTGMKYYIISLLFGLVVIMAVRERQHLVVIIGIILGWGVVNSILAVAQSTISPVFFPAYHFNVFGMDIVESYAVGTIRRASGTFESGPRLAMFLLLPLAMALTFFFRDLFRRKVLWIFLLMVLTAGLFVSFTRIGVVLAVAYLGLYYFFEPQKARIVKTSLAMGGVAVVVLILLFFVIPSDVVGAMETRFTQEGDQVYLDRFYFLYNALMAFTEKPLLGWGVKTYTLHSWDFMQRYPVPWKSLAWDAASLNMPENVPVHNDYGRMLAETGIFSLLAFLTVYVLAFKNLFYTVKRAADPVVESLAISFILFLGVMTVYWFFHEYIMEEPFVSVMPFAFSIVLKRFADENPKPPPARILVEPAAPS
ncbi:MAG: O-antigen ligase family protein [Deltaproteobacteria bacterium]|nr:O-antigen ligase family protein [Deltaproteobacteria bacterium]MCB9487177.1 O-antigen ligase family protein [Deltaproteobacteria bacterium]